MFKFFKKYTTPSKLRAKGVLGMNARNFHIINKCNPRYLFPLVDDKVTTKNLAIKSGVKTPNLIGVIQHQYEVKNILDMVKNYSEFVVKPSHGSGGKGVLVIKGYTEDCFTLPSGKTIKYNDLYQHISNILSGLYSLGGQYDTALVEEIVHFSDVFKEYSYQGVPDVRVIVYKGYPVMAMTRLSTAESGGRANLHQGAVGVGLDIKTGKTKKAVQHNLPITHHPDTKADLRKIEVPAWREHLLIAAKAYEMTGLGYFGADIVLDADKGPMMLELNARPGLAIQIANGSGLKKAIKKVDKNYPLGLSPEQRIDFILN